MRRRRGGALAIVCGLALSTIVSVLPVSAAEPIRPGGGTASADRGEGAMSRVRGPVRVSDPKELTNFPWADITSAGMGITSTDRIRFDIVTEGFTPIDHDDWVIAYTEIDWFVDTDGDAGHEFMVTFWVGGDGRPVGRVYKANADAPRCTANTAVDPVAHRFAVSIARSCIGSPSSIRMYARFHYEDTDFEITRNDVAPDTVWSPSLTLSGGGGGGGGGGGTTPPSAPGRPRGSGIAGGVTLSWAAPTETGSSALTSVTVQRRALVRPVPQSKSSRMNDTRIVGGSDIDISDAPWQVHLYFDGYGCGGTLIDRRWVLTAAHCAEGYGPNAFYVWAGLTRDSNQTLSNAMRTDRVIVHPGWNSDTSENDVALLHLDAPATAGTPIRLSMDRSGPVAGTEAFISGWGNLSSGGSSPDVLQGAMIHVLGGPDDECGQYPSGEFVQRLMLCAGEQGGGQDTCQGDSGGPLVVPVGTTWELAGVTSFGDGCAKPGKPGVYARVSTYAPWIHTQMGWSTARTVSCSATACTSARLTDLTEGTSYLFRVAATNGAGRGPWSTISSAVRAGA